MKVLSLFSGIGGAEIGLEKAGMEIIAQCEIDKHAQKVLRKHWPHTTIHSDIKQLDGNLYHDIDVIVGGFPCVDISIAGKMKGIDAERSGLWKEYLRIVNEARPKYVIIENVENLRKFGLGVVLNDLSRIGYDAEWHCITASSVGLPHKRNRIFIISYPSIKRFDRSERNEGQLQGNEDGKSTEILSKGLQYITEPIQIRPILSRGSFDLLRSTYSSERTSVSSVRRVVNGISSKLDENRRKQRIKQLGNAIVPRIMEIIGKAIINLK